VGKIRAEIVDELSSLAELRSDMLKFRDEHAKEGSIKEKTKFYEKNWDVICPDSPKTYHFTAGFFEGNIVDVLDAFKKCFELLTVPISLSLVFDDFTPNGRIVFIKKEP